MVVLVVALHAIVVMVWVQQPAAPVVAVGALSVSVTLPVDEVKPSPAVSSVPPVTPVLPKPRRVRPEAPAPLPAEDPGTEAQPAVVPPTAPVAQAATPVALAAETAPDYRAASLDNPRPPYPALARRMGWEGRVVLEVEVLAGGRCGGIRVAQGSGHAVLDNAALHSVQNWHFIPATRAGRPVTQWFRIPVQFSL